MAKLPFYGGEGFGDGRIRADVKLKCFDGKVGEGRCSGFALGEGTASHRDMVRRVSVASFSEIPQLIP